MKAGPCLPALLAALVSPAGAAPPAGWNETRPDWADQVVAWLAARLAR